MSPDALNSLFALCIGFSLAGALTSGFQAFAARPAGFGLLQEGVTPHSPSSASMVSSEFFLDSESLLAGFRSDCRSASSACETEYLDGLSGFVDEWRRRRP